MLIAASASPIARENSTQIVLGLVGDHEVYGFHTSIAWDHGLTRVPQVCQPSVGGVDISIQTTSVRSDSAWNMLAVSHRKLISREHSDSNQD